MAGITVAVSIAVVLHLSVSTGQVSPLWQTLSEYVYGQLRGSASAAPLFSAMCVALALGSLALLTGIAKARKPGSVPVLAALGLWCTGLLACAVFRVDPPGVTRSLSGEVHNYAALLAFLALPAAALLLTRKSAAHCPWEPRRSTIRRLAAASLLGVAVVLGAFFWGVLAAPAQPVLTLGLFERLLFGIDLGLLLAMVRPLLSSVSAPRPAH